MTSTDIDYFRQRANEERLAADSASNDRAIEAHREMARQYDDLAGQAGSDPAPTQ